MTQTITNLGGFRKTNRKIFATTKGWDGKDYEGLGRNFTLWKNDQFPDKCFTMMYRSCYKAYCILEVSDLATEDGVRRLEYFTHFAKA